MKKVIALVCGCLMVSAGYAPVAAATAGNTARTLHKRQADFWYTNNFGASAKDVFPLLEPDAIEEDVSHIGLAREDVDMHLGGRIRQEGFLFDRSLTLRDDYNDRHGFTRSKINLDFDTQYGRRQYGKPAAQMHARMTAFTVWDAENTYTPVLEQKVYFNQSNHLKKAEIGKHDHRGVVPRFYLEEGWVRINFDAFVGNMNNDVSLQVGHFPFMVGRGVSLGDYPFTGVEFLGWEREGDIGNVTQRPVGALFSVGLGRHNDINLEFYYSQSRKRSHGPDWTREEIRANRLDGVNNEDPVAIQRGTDNDQDIYAIRGSFMASLGKRGCNNVYVEPYMVVVNAPELKVEFDGDASAQLFTFGSMAEYSSGNWAVNAEFAGQVGYHQMHAIDRNHLVVDDSYYMERATNFDGDGKPGFAGVAGRLDLQGGSPAKFHSHILLGAQTSEPDNLTSGESEYLPYRNYYIDEEMQHINSHRDTAHQGDLVRIANTTTNPTLAAKPGAAYDNKTLFDSLENLEIPQDGPYGAYKFKSGIDYYDNLFTILGVKPDGFLHNANMPFGGMRRFRPEYRLSCRSIMALCDVAYTTDDKRAVFAAAFGHIGGDEYPFNTEEDKKYSGFIPHRDANYVGRWVTSFVMLYPRKLPRPIEMADKDFLAHKNYQTMQNLQFVGLSAKWLPFEHKNTLSLEGNALYFWQVAPPHKWDVNTDRQFVNSKSSNGIGKETSFYKYIQDKELHFSGSATHEYASSALGAELNGVIKWLPFANCELVARLGVFMPGQLYKDIEGCPNINTRRVGSNLDGDVRHDSLGTKLVTGGMLRMTYKF